MELEGSQNRVGRATEWRWKRDRIAVEGSWAVGLPGDESACAISTRNSNSWASCCCGKGGVKEKMRRDTILAPGDKGLSPII
eukprot:scaffold54361_cov59-Cyclotella_meneghiniana.AAC.1